MAQLTVEIDVIVVRSSESALLVSDGDQEVWVPHTAIQEPTEIDMDSLEGDDGIITLTESYATKLGLV